MKNMFKCVASLSVLLAVGGLGCDLSMFAIPPGPETPVTGFRGVNVYNCSQNYDNGPPGATFSIWLAQGHVVEAPPEAWTWVDDVFALNFGDSCGYVGSNHSATTFDFPSSGDWTVSVVQQVDGCDSSNGNHSGCLAGQYTVQQYTQDSSGNYDSIKMQ